MRRSRTMSSITTNPLPETWARPGPSYGVRVWAGAALVAGALMLVALGGCFLVGAMVLVRPELVGPAIHASSLSSESVFLLTILYILAFVCFVGALLLIVLGVRGLIRILQDGRDPS